MHVCKLISIIVPGLKAAVVDQTIPVNVDGGRRYILKMDKIKLKTPTQQAWVFHFCHTADRKISLSWTTGAQNFNKGHIHHHVVESVQFLNEDTFDDDSDSDGDFDNDCDIEDLHTAELMKKGLKYFNR